MRSPTLAIVVQFNAAEMTARCLRDLQRQTRSCDVLIVDNGSTDRSPERLSTALRPGDGLVRTGARLGFAEAVNLGLDHALSRGYDCVYLAGNDSEMPANVLDHLLAALAADPSAGAAGPIQVYAAAPDRIFSAGGALDRRTWATRHHGLNEDLEEGRFGAPAHPDWLDFASILIPVPVLRAVGPLRTGYRYYWEDVDWCLRAGRAGYRLIVEPRAVVRHHVSATGGQNPERKQYLLFRNRLRCARAIGGPRFALSLLAREWLYLARCALVRRTTPRIEPLRLAATFDFTFRREYRY